MNRPLNDDARWPEALARLAAGESIRTIAASIGTNPRRLRRALARRGIRAAGANLDHRGVVALAPHRSRLGTVPDAVVARMAGVTPEAVQGERRRLGIAAFRPRSTWEEVEPVAPSPAPEPPPPPAPNPAFRRDRSVAEPAVVVKKPVSRESAPVRRLVRPEMQPGPALPRGVLAFRANEPAVAWSPPVAPATPVDERRLAIDRLLVRPAELPRDRTRMVRAEGPMIEPGPKEVTPTLRRPRGPAWRVPDASVLAELTARAAAEPAPAPRTWAPLVTPSAPRPVTTAPPVPPPAAVAVVQVATPVPREPAWSLDGPAWTLQFLGLGALRFHAPTLLDAIQLAERTLPPAQFPIVAIEACA